MHLQLTFAAAALFAAVSADNKFLNRVRDGGLCLDDDFEGELTHPTGLIGSEYITRDQALVGEGSFADYQGLQTIPKALGSVLDSAIETLPNGQIAHISGPGSYEGFGTHVGGTSTYIPAKQVDVNTYTNHCTEGKTDAEYASQQKRGEVYSLRGNLCKNTHSCGYAELD